MLVCAKPGNAHFLIICWTLYVHILYSHMHEAGEHSLRPTIATNDSRLAREHDCSMRRRRARRICWTGRSRGCGELRSLASAAMKYQLGGSGDLEWPIVQNHQLVRTQCQHRVGPA